MINSYFDLHFLEMQILKELLFHPNSRFSDLNISEVSTDDFSYHLNNLKKLGFIEKKENFYLLTKSGKEFANRMETDFMMIEKQPKVSVMVIPVKKIGEKVYFASQRRMKEPYFGYIGFMSGKMKYGETVFESASRELNEEMGLTSSKFEYFYNLHEMVYDKQGNLLEDKFFNVVEAKEVKGKIRNSKSGENSWVTKAEFMELKPKYHNEDDIFNWYLTKDKSFKEFKYYIEKF